MQKPSLEKIIRFAVGVEENGEKFYQDLSKKFSSNGELVDLFAGLAMDEKTHKKQYENLLRGIPQINWETVDEEKWLALQATAISDFFDTETGPFKDIDQIKTAKDGLKLAFDFEKATLAYYRAVSDIVGYEFEALNTIIRSEKQHVFAVMKLLITDSKYRSLSDNWSY